SPFRSLRRNKAHEHWLFLSAKRYMGLIAESTKAKPGTADVDDEFLSTNRELARRSCPQPCLAESEAFATGIEFRGPAHHSLNHFSRDIRLTGRFGMDQAANAYPRPLDSK